jgi:excisionase family DNA binding protein
MTIKEAAAYLRCSTRTIHRHIDAKTLAGVQLVPGGRVLISINSIEKMIEFKQH